MRGETTWGAAARSELQRRGLLFFADVVDEVQRWTKEVDVPAVFALAVAVAQRIASLSPPPDSGGTIPPARQLLQHMWQTLRTPDDLGLRDRISEIVSELRECDGADDDLVAATIYASMVRTNPAAVGWVVSRLIDTTFDRIESGDGATNARIGDQQDFISNCGAPLIQGELSRIRGMMNLINENGTTEEVLRALAQAS